MILNKNIIRSSIEAFKLERGMFTTMEGTLISAQPQTITSEESPVKAPAAKTI